LTLASFAPTSAGAKQPTVEEQVTVLLKWYHTYLENGKYNQAREIAEAALELAPDDPQTIAAAKIARRRRFDAPEKGEIHQKLEKVLTKLDQLELHLRELETQKTQLEKQVRALQSQNERMTRHAPHEEPRGSPDRID
jgi:hypothetical protein